MSENKLIHFGSKQTLILFGTLKGVPTLCLKYLDRQVPDSQLSTFDHSYIEPEAYLTFSTKESASKVCDAMFIMLQMFDQIKNSKPLTTEDWVETIRDGVL